ncbi:Rne/Rng family ribonuclease [Marivibrio halodurans]|uniref:Ribonuclease E n=1 Tax=Marivibrio halodurans TaxID=2039722 RepID=A0A8J7RXB4_9PROT|nr:ribonuclease E/G [Marivibrio halodurans]MBP5856135.1 Rne/Rng family ribonuclease [Marivibrio halodurans]
MTRRMLIDATHPEETRVTVVNGNKLEEFDYETTTKAQLKGNIYLAKVTRVEPSLQAAFVEYGGNRHGFLAFGEIHPDYYRIPVSDREDLVEEHHNGDEDHGDDEARGADGEPVEDMGGAEAVDEAVEEAQRRRPRLKRQYKIQEVIKRRQVMLVQVVKEERGNKGAALTTYLSLAGRYCVLMPNTSRGGGVSRKIANAQDRKRLKTVMSELETPEGMAVILRTAGAERSKAEIKRDFEYILKLWDDIRQKTLQSTAPALIHEEANLIKRSIRDLYSKDIEEVLVSGEEAYKTAKDFMKALVPSHAKKVQRYKDDQGIPLFHRYQVEQQLAQIHDPQVQLRSGGTIVIHQTEALVAIDVNSGRATRERHIEETALKTNLEAAEEVARQLRLRDLAGLIVIDFIDMDDGRNIGQVERKLKESLRRDRARIQVGRISAFGLMEMSRQRLRPSLIEAMSQPCPTCGGVGYIASTETAALICLRAIEEEGLRRRSAIVKARVPVDVALYILNHKRASMTEMEQQFGMRVTIEADSDLLPPKYELTRTASEDDDAPEHPVEESREQPVGGDEGGGRRRPRRGGRRRSGREEEERDQRDSNDNAVAAQEEDSDDTGSGGGGGESASDEDGGDRGRRRRKRGRRGGRRRNRRPEDGDQRQDSETGGDEGADRYDAADRDDAMERDDSASEEPVSHVTEESKTPESIEPREDSESAGESEERPKPRKARAKRPRGRRAATKPEGEEVAGTDADTQAAGDGAAPPDGMAVGTPGAGTEENGDALTAASEEAPKPRRRRSRKAAPSDAAAEPAAEKNGSSGDGSEGDGASEGISDDAAVADAPEPAAKKAKGKAKAKRARARKKAPAAKPEPAPAAEQAGDVGATDDQVADSSPDSTPPSEAEAEPVAPAPEATPEAGPDSTREPASEKDAASDPMEQYIVSDGSEKKEDRPKRKGWWNRMLG